MEYSRDFYDRVDLIADGMAFENEEDYDPVVPSIKGLDLADRASTAWKMYEDEGYPLHAYNSTYIKAGLDGFLLVAYVGSVNDDDSQCEVYDVSFLAYDLDETEEFGFALVVNEHHDEDRACFRAVDEVIMTGLDEVLVDAKVSQIRRVKTPLFLEEACRKSTKWYRIFSDNNKGEWS